MFFFLFAQARYYLPETGRFISEDSWFGQLEIPITLHKYIYCYDNPLVYVDRNGQWGTFIHKWETERIANDIFKKHNLKDLKKYSEIIGEGDESVDSGSTSPKKPFKKPQSWHFNANGVGKTGTAEDSRMMHYEECHKEAVKKWKEADEKYIKRENNIFYKLAIKMKKKCEVEKEWLKERDKARKKAMYKLGRGLHALQDIDAHMSYGEEKFGRMGIIIAHRTVQDDADGNGIWSPGYFDNPNNDITKKEDGKYSAKKVSEGKFSSKVKEDNEYEKWKSPQYKNTVKSTEEALTRFLKETGQIK